MKQQLEIFEIIPHGLKILPQELTNKNILLFMKF